MWIESCHFTHIHTTGEPLPARSMLEILTYNSASSMQTFEVGHSGVILDQYQWSGKLPIAERYWLVFQYAASYLKRRMCDECSECTYFISCCSSVLQICPRIVSRKSPQRCVCLPPSSCSISTTTASSASQRPLSICRCWLILTSGLWLPTLRSRIGPLCVIMHIHQKRMCKCF